MGTISNALDPVKWLVSKAVYERYRKRFSEVTHETWPNLYWVIVWDMTWKCNVRCPYCWQDHDGFPEGEDIEKGLQTVIQAQPRMLLISGGEAGLLPELGSVLKTVKKECDNPYIVINTNLVSGGEKWEELVDFYDGLNVSLDGLGEANKLNRGYNGDPILRRVEELHRAHPDKSLCLHAVVTKATLPHIGEYVSKVRSFSPRVGFMFMPRLPYHHPDSVASDNHTLRRFISTADKLQRKYTGVQYTAPAPLPSEKRTVGKMVRNLARSVRKPLTITCHRQFFRADIRPSGQLQPCRPYRTLPEIDRALVKHGTDRNLIPFLRTYQQFLMQYRHGPGVYNPRCSNPCHCELFIEPMLLATEPDSEVFSCELFKGRFREEDIERGTRFIQQNINPGFRKEFLDPFRRKSTP
jgi:MoaA/NifB/PqqE/SkfB family radical SAM enzyme